MEFYRCISSTSKEIIYMKCHSLFSVTKKNNISLASAKFAHRIVV